MNLHPVARVFTGDLIIIAREDTGNGEIKDKGESLVRFPS
jgi:hypothetical protein